MFELVNMLGEKRRSVIVVTACILPLLLVSLLAPVVQANRVSLAAGVQAAHDDQTTLITDDGANAVANALSGVVVNSGDALDTLKIQALNVVMAAAGDVTRMNKDIAHGTATAITTTGRGIGSGVAVTAHAVGDSFSFSWHVIGSTVGFAAGMTHVSALIRPADHTPTPTITQIRAQQASIIQTGTTNVAILAAASGTGGACDVGQGNGSYPLSWCDAPMDSLATVAYTSDRINRECTSYASWYFTNVEGHGDFHVSGDARYWAGTSNYPTHAAPAVGAIAVETVGAYGHVAIVQALSGQTYAGQVVPAGDVLVSEMNYDWHGHFRYSYSPVGKFATYIYP